MIIQPFATSTTPPVSGPASSGSSSSPAAAGSAPNVSENEFLQLLVAQIQNQDPTNPTDSTAFVTQLAQFSSLEQLVGIHQDLDNQTPTAAGTPTANTTGGTN